MTALLRDFVRVRRGRPCPVCGKTDWCLVSRDDETTPSKVICQRVESPHRWRDAGWLHRLGANPRPQGPWRCRSLRLDGPADGLADLAERFAAASDEREFGHAASHFGLSVASLRRLGASAVGRRGLAPPGFGNAGPRLAFPMRDGKGRVIGIRLRATSSAKYAVTGSRNGLFFDPALPACPKELLLAEGETDAAALLDLGFVAVGRPSCRGAADLIRDLVRRVRPEAVVVVADNDAPGVVGAAELANELCLYCEEVKVIRPPTGIKDIRAWKLLGAQPEQIRTAIEAGCPFTPVLFSKKGGHS